MKKTFCGIWASAVKAKDIDLLRLEVNSLWDHSALMNERGNTDHVINMSVS